MSYVSGATAPYNLTGATGATRYVGATTSGAPASGTFNLGDFIIDQTGQMYVCTVAGSPGTWVEVGAGQPLALTGATGATRYVGGTTDGPPTSGTFAIGDWIVSRADGAQWVCTTAGTPGTWKVVGFQRFDAFKRTGAIRENFSRKDNSMADSAAVLTTARALMTSIWLAAGDVVTNLNALTGATAPTLTHGMMGLYDSSRNLIRQSTDSLTSGWTASSEKTLALDSIPVTAGARVASTTVTLTIPTLNQALSAILAVSDSVVVSNANIAAYNGTFALTGVTATTITYTAGSSATDSLAAPFPTVQLASGKRTFTVPSSGLYYASIAQVGTVNSFFATNSTSVGYLLAPILLGHATDVIVGTLFSPAGALGSTDNRDPWVYVS